MAMWSLLHLTATETFTLSEYICASIFLAMQWQPAIPYGHIHLADSNHICPCDTPL
jgi:hypothetical protein